MKQNHLPPSLLPWVERFQIVATGIHTRDFALSFTCADHHVLTLRAFGKALQLGYQRPGLVLDQVIDDLVEHRFSTGYYSGQETLPKTRRLRLFFQVAEAMENPKLFETWLQTEKPDVIFT